MTKSIWISYDLGIKGDYSGMYTWLDNYAAKECGDSLAFIHYEYKKDFIDELLNDITDYVTLKKTDRLYIVYQDDSTNKIKGKFISGKRKGGPWEGYGEKEGFMEEDF